MKYRIELPVVMDDADWAVQETKGWIDVTVVWDGGELLRPDQADADSCGCRMLRPCWSSGVLLLVQDSAKTVASSHVQVDDLGPGGHRAGPRRQWRYMVQGSVRPVGAVACLELA